MSLTTMNSFGLPNGRISGTLALSNIPADKHLKLKQMLDHNSMDKNWRALIRAVEKEYPIKPYERESWAALLNSGESPSCRLLTQLSSRGMTVKELADYLDCISLDPYPLGLVGYEDIKVLEKPLDSYDLEVGDTMRLTVVAKGHPYPKYRWFFCGDNYHEYEELRGQVESTLQVLKVCLSEGGVYTCQIHNSRDPDKAVNVEVVVTVKPRSRSPSPERKVHPNLPAFETDHHIYMPDQCEPLTNRSKGSLPTGLIIKQPDDIMVRMNDSFVVAVETQGYPPITYQWIRNGVPIACNLPKLMVESADSADLGEYQCIVNNNYHSERTRISYVKQHYLPQPPERKEIVIISNPKSCTVSFGGSATFYCEARCSDHMEYQWYKDGNMLQDKIAAELTYYNIQEVSFKGMYQCEISIKGDRRVRCLSSGAMLNVKVPQEIHNVEYNPSDKVAILIGNYDYRSEECLSAPKNDVQVLCEAFNALGFKVVSLLNLTKSEMESAVYEFCKLIGKNVYAVFYFCGHGFEGGGCSFMVPTDAKAGYTSNDCVNSYEVIQQIQAKEPALILCILDICRKPNKIQGEVPSWNPDNYTVRGNTFICYATSPGMNAFEDRCNGLLVHHLQPIMQDRVSIETLMQRMRQGFNARSEQQIPQIQTNLRESDRSLTDKISWKGNTEVFQERTQIWLNAHRKPDRQVVKINELGIEVVLDFQAEFSNILNVFVTVKEKGRTSNCEAYISNWPPTVALQGQLLIVRDEPKTTKIVLQDIQKLQSDLTVHVTLKYRLPGSNQYNILNNYVVNLGLPLIAKLQLWRPREGLVRKNREATESADDVSSVSY